MKLNVLVMVWSRARPVRTVFQRWVQQPTTIGGLSLLVGALASYFTGHRDAAIVAGASAVVGMILPDSSGAKAPAEKLLVDATTAALDRNLVASVPSLVHDAEVLAADLPARPSPPKEP